MFKLIPFPYNLIASAVVAALFCGMCWYAWHEFTGHYVDIGVAREHVHTVAAEEANKSLAAERDAARRELTEAQDAYHAENERISKEKALNAARAAAKIKSLEAERDSLAAAAAGPPAPTRKESCDEADQLLDDYVARRLRD